MAAANHYELLQIKADASAQELRQAFRRLSKHYHPDTTELPEREAAEGFRHLQQAYLTLLDPERRRAYDATLRAVAPALRPLPRVVVSAPKPVPVRRALSGGEWFALLLLALAVLFSLVLGVGLAWARGTELLRPPSWMAADEQTALIVADGSADVAPAATPDAALQPPAAAAGELAA